MNRPARYAPAAYIHIVPILSELARKLGYAITVHGSMANDLDVVAVPWVDEAVSAQELYEEVCDRFSFYRDQTIEDPHHLLGPTEKPHGRIAWTIPLAGGCAIDLSVTPRIGVTRV